MIFKSIEEIAVYISRDYTVSEAEWLIQQKVLRNTEEIGTRAGEIVGL
jgi:hypothetical protein